jgi:hypothetical protein
MFTSIVFATTVKTTFAIIALKGLAWIAVLVALILAETLAGGIAPEPPTRKKAEA